MVLLFLHHKDASKLQNIIGNFLQIKIKSCLALNWSSLLIFLWVFMGFILCVQWCHSFHTDPLADFCAHTIVIFTLVLPVRIIRALPRLRRHCSMYCGVADPSASVEPVQCLQHTKQCNSARISSDYAHCLYSISEPLNHTNIRTRASV